jgi:hypothetical protein
VIVYTPERRALTLDLDQVTGETVNAWWFDPASGTAVFAGEFASSGQHSFMPPWDADWVLVVDDVAMELPAPGAGHGVELRSTSSVKGRYRKRS